MGGVLHLEGEAIIGQDDSKALTCQEVRNRGIQAAAAIVATHPGPAVNEHHYGKVSAAMWQVQIETVPVAFVVNEIAYVVHREGIRSWCARCPQGNISH